MVEVARPADVLGLPKLDVKNRVTSAGSKVKAKMTSTALNVKQIIANDIAKLADVRAQVSAHLKRPFEMQYQPVTPAERRAELQALSHVMNVVHQDYDRQKKSGRTDIPPTGDFRIQDLIRRANDTAEAYRQIGKPQTEIGPYVKLAVKLEHKRDAAIIKKHSANSGGEAATQRTEKVSARTVSPRLEKQVRKPASTLRRETATASLNGQ